MCVENYPQRYPAVPAVVVVIVVVVVVSVAVAELPAVVAALSSVALLAESLTRLWCWSTNEAR